MGLEDDIPGWKRMEVVQFLQGSCIDGKVPYGKVNEAALRFHVSRKSVSRIWKSAKEQGARGEVVSNLSIRNKRIRKKKWEIDYAQIEAVPVDKRGTIQSMSDAIKVPKSTLGRWAKAHLLRPHTSSIKSLLTAPNMLVRLSFSLQAIHYDRGSNMLKFKPMENTVHIDEKWFYLTRNTCRYYLTPMEADPHRVAKSKNFIPKVMFMCAVCRPLFDMNGNVLFDGKIGMWPFVEEVRAQRSSIRRPRGTIEIKPMQSINREVIKDCILNQVIPAIKHKWPSTLSKDIKIQQDNARPHIKNTDSDFESVANADGFHIELVQQPPNSPDCNALDLGLFTTIQSLQQRKKCKNAAELIQAVQISFRESEAMTLNKVFLSLQCVLLEIMKVKWHNNFKQPHMKKDSLIRQGILPTNLEVPIHLVRDNIDYLIGEEYTSGIEELMTELEIIVPQIGEGVPDLNF